MPWLISQAPQAPAPAYATPAADLMALAFFCGLRPGEIGGLRWEDFDAEWVHVRRSVWRGIAKLPKTQTGIRCVPPIDRVRLFLSCGMRSVASPRKAEFLKAIAGNLPTCTASLIAIIPAVRGNGLEWKSIYAGRRGAGTIHTQLTGDALAAQQILGHKNLAVTAYYVKPIGAARD